MKIIKTVASMGIILASMINAEEVTTIENHSKHPIKVFFGAAGCWKVSDGLTLTCKSQTIQPRTPTGPGSSSYTWKWGQTGKWVYVKEGKYFFYLTNNPNKGKYYWRGHKVIGGIGGRFNDRYVEVPRPINSYDFSHDRVASQ